MIVRETPTRFICITQHDHAHVAGVLAAHWQPAYFEDAAHRPEVEFAIYQHDRGWIPLDDAPAWNEQTQTPHSFLTHPTEPRVRHYQQGVTEVAQMVPYAGLLCSLHYTGFPDLAKSEVGHAFMQQEQARQHQLGHQLRLTTPAQQANLDFHLQLLKFCDRLSLYLCLNEPGTDKAHEHPWYREGIPFSDYFNFSQGHLLQARWLSTHHVQVQPFPFDEAFYVDLPYRELPKDALTTAGLAACFAAAPVQELRVQLVR
ncbi:DUF3891 family protein [Hymenobacter tenuis]